MIWVWEWYGQDGEPSVAAYDLHIGVKVVGGYPPTVVGRGSFA